jgi:hypothetical protein
VGFDGWLRDGEEVRWSGKPVRGMPIDRIDVTGTLLLVLLVVFAVVWQENAPGETRLTVLVVSIIAFAAVAGALVRRRSGAASYVITNYRVLVQSAKGIDGIPLAGLAAPTVFGERRDGVGNISFGPPNRLRQAVTALIRGPDAPHRRMHLVQIEQARAVADVVTAAQRRRRR